MNKSDIISVLREKHGLSKELSRQVVNTVFESIADAIANNEHVTISDFGSFELKERPGREYTDPFNRSITVPDRMLPSFKASRKLKTKCSKK